MTSDWRRHIRLQDFVWLLLFSALAVFSPVRSPIIVTLLVAVGAVQALEARIGAKTSILLNLVLCYPLIYLSGGIGSSFWMLLLVPVISAATSFGLLRGALITLLACTEDLSFLARLIWEDREYPLRELFPRPGQESNAPFVIDP